MKKINVKNEKLFKNKWQMIIYCILFIILIGAFIYLGTLDYDESLPDNEQFAEDFSLVSEDNVFKYVNATDALMVAMHAPLSQPNEVMRYEHLASILI